MEDTEFIAAAEQYRDMIYRVALHACGNPQDAEDAVQETLLRLYLSRKPFAGEDHQRCWLIRVTINVCRDLLRSPWRRRRVPLDSVTPSFQQPEQGILYQTVMDLPEKYRIILYLFYYEELSVRDISELLDLKQTTVTTRLSRARKLLKKQLTEVWQDDE